MFYLPNFLLPDQDTPWEPEVVTMLGKQHVLRRQTAQFGRDYDYNLTPKLAAIERRIVGAIP